MAISIRQRDESSPVIVTGTARELCDSLHRATAKASIISLIGDEDLPYCEIERRKKANKIRCSLNRLLHALVNEGLLCRTIEYEQGGKSGQFPRSKYRVVK